MPNLHDLRNARKNRDKQARNERIHDTHELDQSAKTMVGTKDKAKNPNSRARRKDEKSRGLYNKRTGDYEH